MCARVRVRAHACVRASVSDRARVVPGSAHVPVTQGGRNAEEVLNKWPAKADDKYENLGCLGSGSFGNVYKARRRCDGVEVCLAYAYVLTRSLIREYTYVLTRACTCKHAR